ncbi:LSU ribosomal protein L25p [Halorhodospira halochloris]|uniref:Large ribosomal subunit protein bL25 n=1 Tax=Halorhodospira halochloris TaxID=1052 RepID=A0A0X8X6E4_HALHR|nr:50S ribosomal protein L25/general stress protein Ctc [Halorhodospira halochloris]MBK1651015.1 50S ribosomal protein L25/general stress protein Ctc [Halorhodospira halochloris]MCG5547357.1 50S ribosomal protein L25/general stress protein Ctc [Halorhodospira halochloris]BAU56474.1 LSU ribosomal protein L25p [Halorhodospira halochloris]
MTVEMTLDAHPRSETGRGAMRRLRRARRVPGIVYGAGKEPQPVAIDNDQLYRLLEEESFFSSILELKIGSEKTQAIVKDMQRHPYKPLVQHIDLQRVQSDRKIFVQVPLHIHGEEVSPGVKKGGVLHHDMLDIEVVCYPQDLPTHIDVDVSKLDVGKAVHISELHLPSGVESAALQHGVGHDAPVVSVQATRKTRGGDSGGEESAESE